MLQDSILLSVTTPADIDTKTTQTVDLTAQGFGAAQAAELQPRIVCKRGSNGVGKVMDEAVAIASTGVMTITEGASGFAAGDVYTIALLRGVKGVTAVKGAT